MDGDTNELFNYANSVLERFSNPYVRHLLIDICLNYTSKFKTRDLPSVIGYIEKFGKVPPVLSFSIAALINFYKTCKEAKEDQAILDHFAALFAKTSDAKEIVTDVLSQEAWWGENLNNRAGLTDAVASSLAKIWSDGMNNAVTDLVK